MLLPPPPLTDAELAALGAGEAVVRDGVIGASAALQCREVIQSLRAAGGMKAAGISQAGTLRPEIRGDSIAWLDEVAQLPELAELWSWFDALRELLNRDAWLGLRRFSLQVACYPGGGARYLKHRDAFAGSRNRTLTAILYLNPDWKPEDGGQLRIWGEEGPREIEPLLDRLVFFLSERLEHEVMPCWAERYTATAWYRGREDVPLLPDVERA